MQPSPTAERLTAVFERIHRERMAGLPILHPALSVAVVGAREWRGAWAGVLITPWCMNLVLIPAPGSGFVPGPTGSKQVLELPAGAFELIASEEPDIGPFAACSLFSPMQQFADQAAALATAEAVMQQLFEPDPPPAAPQPAAAPGISRRDLLRGTLSGQRKR
jgi:[NiFe] hydrogenase assembly HybE family chaperone